jgi:hypothetical protein
MAVLKEWKQVMRNFRVMPPHDEYNWSPQLQRKLDSLRLLSDEELTRPADAVPAVPAEP